MPDHLKQPTPNPTTMKKETDLYNVPGFVSELTEYILSDMPTPNRPCAFAAAFALLSHLAGRKYVGENRAAPNLLLTLVGETGCGKTTATNSAISLALELGLNVHTGCFKDNDLEDCLIENPLTLLMDCSVLRLFWHPKSKLARILKTTFDDSVSTWRREPTCRTIRRGAPHKIVAPHVTLLGVTCPEETWWRVRPQTFESGVVQRMLFIEADPVRAMNPYPKQIKFSSGIMQHAKKLLAGKPDAVETRETFDTKHDLTVVPFAAGGREAWRELLARNDARTRELGKQFGPFARSRAAAMVRRAELAGRCALLYALSENADEPQLTPAAFDWAFRFVECLQDTAFENAVAASKGKRTYWKGGAL